MTSLLMRFAAALLSAMPFLAYAEDPLFFEDKTKARIRQANPYCSISVSNSAQDRSVFMDALSKGNNDALTMSFELNLLGILPMADGKPLENLRKAKTAIARHNLLFYHLTSIRQRKANISEVRQDLSLYSNHNFKGGPVASKTAYLYALVASQVTDRSQASQLRILEALRLASNHIPEAIVKYTLLLERISPRKIRDKQVSMYLKTTVNRWSDRNVYVQLLKAKMHAIGLYDDNEKNNRRNAALYYRIANLTAQKFGVTIDQSLLDELAPSSYELSNDDSIENDARRYIEVRKPVHEVTNLSYEWTCPWQDLLRGKVPQQQ